jgi:hypothetical protein
MSPRRDRFDGYIAGWGTASGTRVVLGHWERSPFGPFSDVMLASPDGTRTLIAPEIVADFIASTYRFDRIVVAPVVVRFFGASWSLSADGLVARFRTGARTWLGYPLRAVPPLLARSPAWITLVDILARPLLPPGVRIRGTAGQNRREWYGALDAHHLIDFSGTLDGVDLGALAPVEPPVRFGFASTPPWPSIVRVVTTVEVSAGAVRVGG